MPIIIDRRTAEIGDRFARLVGITLDESIQSVAIYAVGATGQESVEG